MGHYIKLIYPENVNMTTYSANFLDLGNRYLITETYEDGKVSIRLQAKIWDDETDTEIIGTIDNVEISNDPDFYTSISTEDYEETYIYQCNKNEDGEISITKQDPAGGDPNVIIIQDWYLIGTQGEHTVYIRFNYTILGETYTYPPTNYNYKGYSDTIVWATSPPSTPGKPKAINATFNGFVGEQVLWTAAKSKDFVVGLDSYLVDLFVNNSQLYLLEKFEEEDSLVFAENLDPLKRYDWANTREIATPPELSIVIRGSTFNDEYQSQLGLHSFDFDEDNTKPSLNTDYYSSVGVGGVEFSLHNKISSKGAGLAFRYDIASQEPSGSTTGLVGHWKFEDNAKDNSEYKNHGIEQNGVAYGNGKIGKCANLNSANKNYILVPFSESLNLESTGTICAWVLSNIEYPSTTTETIYRPIAGKTPLTSGNVKDVSYLLDWYGTDSAGTLRAAIGDGSNIEGVNTSYTFTPGEWYHIAYTWDETNHTLYINGVPAAAPKAQTKNALNQEQPFRIGNLYDNTNSTAKNYWDGKLDEVKVYNTALSAEAIEDEYQRNINQHMYVAIKNFADTYDDSELHAVINTPIFLNLDSEVTKPYDKIDDIFIDNTNKDYILTQIPISTNVTLKDLKIKKAVQNEFDITDNESIITIKNTTIPPSGILEFYYNDSEYILSSSIGEDEFQFSTNNIIAQQFRLNKNIPEIKTLNLLFASKNGDISLGSRDARVYITLCDGDGNPAAEDYSTIESWFNYTEHGTQDIFWVPDGTYTISENELQSVTFIPDPEEIQNFSLKAGVNYLLLIVPTAESSLTSLTVGITGDDKIVDGRRFIYTASFTVAPDANIEGNIDIAFSFMDALGNVVYSTIINKTAEITCYHRTESHNSQLIFRLSVEPLILGNKYFTFGHQSDETQLNTSLFLDHILMDDVLVIPSIDILNPDDLDIDTIISNAILFSGIPYIGSYSKWEHLITAAIDSAHSHISSGTNNTSDIEYWPDNNSNAFILESGSYTSTIVEEGAQASGGWQGYDIYYSEASNDDSIYIKASYALDTLPDYDEAEFYILISTREPVTSMVDISRMESYYNSLNFLRISFLKDNNIKIYKNDSFVEEMYKVVTGISLKYGTVEIFLTNETDTDKSKLTIKITPDSNIASGTEIRNKEYFVIFDEYLDKRYVPHDENGFYAVLGVRVKNDDRENSSLIFSNLICKPSRGTIISMEDMTHAGASQQIPLYLYPELTGLNIQDTNNNWIFSDKDELLRLSNKKYILGLYDLTLINETFYFMSPENIDENFGTWSTNQQLISWGDISFIQRDNLVPSFRCFGILVSNIANNQRDNADNQRYLLLDPESASPQKDLEPPYADRNEWGNVSNSRMVGTDYNKIEMYVNARGTSQNQWVTSEYQWYEAMSPWNNNNNWPGAKDGRYKPVEVDALKTTDHSIEFNYELTDGALPGNMEVYFGIANFKPAYRIYNNGINEKYIENYDQGYTIEGHPGTEMLEMPINAQGSIKIDKYIWNPNYLSLAYTFGEINNPLNCSMRLLGERFGINEEDTMEQEFKYIYPLPKIPTSESVTESYEYLSKLKWMQLAISNDRNIYVEIEPKTKGDTNKQNETSARRKWVDTGANLPPMGKIKVDIKRYLNNTYNPTTNGGINAVTGQASEITDSGLPDNIWYPKSEELKEYLDLQYETDGSEYFVILIDRSYPYLSFTQINFIIDANAHYEENNILWYWDGARRDNLNVELNEELFANITYQPFTDNPDDTYAVVNNATVCDVLGRDGPITIGDKEVNFITEVSYIVLVKSTAKKPDETETTLAINVTPSFINAGSVLNDAMFMIENSRNSTEGANWNILSDLGGSGMEWYSFEIETYPSSGEYHNNETSGHLSPGEIVLVTVHFDRDAINTSPNTVYQDTIRISVNGDGEYDVSPLSMTAEEEIIIMASSYGTRVPTEVTLTSDICSSKQCDLHECSSNECSSNVCITNECTNFTCSNEKCNTDNCTGELHNDIFLCINNQCTQHNDSIDNDCSIHGITSTPEAAVQCFLNICEYHLNEDGEASEKTCNMHSCDNIMVCGYNICKFDNCQLDKCAREECGGYACGLDSCDQEGEIILPSDYFSGYPSNCGVHNLCPSDEALSCIDENSNSSQGEPCFCDGYNPSYPECPHVDPPCNENPPPPCLDECNDQICQEEPCQEEPCQEEPCQEEPCQEEPCQEEPCNEQVCTECGIHYAVEDPGCIPHYMAFFYQNLIPIEYSSSGSAVCGEKPCAPDTNETCDNPEGLQLGAGTFNAYANIINVKPETFSFSFTKQSAKLFSEMLISADVMTLSIVNEAGTTTKVAEIYREHSGEESMIDDFYQYLYFHMGIREKYNTDTFKTALSNVEIASSDDNIGEVIQPSSVASWLKTDGSYADHDLIYGKNIVLAQSENDNEQLIINYQYPHVAQKIKIETPTSLAENMTTTGATIGCILIKVEDSSEDIKEWRCVITGSQEIVGVMCPDIAIGPGDDGNRPKNDLQIYSSDALGVAFGRKIPGSDLIEFVFDPPIEINVYDDQNEFTTTYWAVITHPSLSSVLLDDNTANNYPISMNYDTEAEQYLTDLYIKTGDDNKYLEDSNIITYNITDEFTEIEKNMWIKVYSGSYINLKNKIDGQQISIKMAARNYAGLISDRSTAADYSTVDLTQPIASFEVLDTVSRRCDLKITATDSASGIWRFRVVYKDDFNVIKYDQWEYWTAAQGEDYVLFSWYYPGKFYGDKELFVQVQDYVGNIANTNVETVNMKHKFIIDTEPPYSTMVSINNDSEYLSSDIANVEINAIDDTTGIKDVRGLIGEDDEGNPIYEQWRPFQENLVLDMSEESDGYKSISYQFRDYANNADQAEIAHALIKTLCPDKLPTAIESYGYSGEDALYIASTKLTEEEGLVGVYKYVDTLERTTFEFQYETGSKKFFTSSEIITVYIDGEELLEEDEGTTNWTLDLLNQIIRFSTAYPEEIVITASVSEEVVYLDIYDGESLDNVYVFDSERERLATAMIVYGNKLYIGFASGKIYSYDGAVITYEYLLTSEAGETLPVGAFGIHQFTTETRELLFIGSLKEARLWSYGGNPAITNYNWKLVDDINNYIGYISAQSGIINDNVFNNTEDWMTTTPVRFNNQNSVISLDSYGDYLFIGTGDTSSEEPGDGSAVFIYGKYYDNDGYTIITDIKVNLLQIISKNNGGTQVRALKEFGNKIYAGTNKNSIFAYEIIKKQNPYYDIWDNKTIIDESFLIKYYPWRYYEAGGISTGSTDPAFSDYLSITSYFDSILGDIDYYTLNIACGLGAISRFDQTISDTPWYTVENSTGWTVETELKYVEGDNGGYQGLEIFDGAYQAEIKFYSNKIEVISKDKSDTINISDIELDEYYAVSELNSINWTAPEDSNAVANIIDNSLSISIESDENEEAYVELSSTFNTGKDSKIDIEIAARNFVFSTINIKLYWLEDGETEYTETHSHSFNVYNSNMSKNIVIYPSWSSKTISKMKLVIPSIYGASLNIDKFEVTGEENKGIIITEINKFRITGKNATLTVYVNDNNTPIFRKIDWLEASGGGKSLSFGKNDYESVSTKFAWKSIKFTKDGAYKPKTNEHINWTLSGVFPSTSKIKKFESISTSLYAYADPLDLIINIVPENKLHPVVWKLPSYDSLYWGDPEGIEDSYFGYNIISVIDTAVWRNHIYSVAEYVKTTEDIRNDLKNKFDIIENAISGDPISSNICGNLYIRKRSHSGYDEIIKDTMGPNASILINADEASNGIKVYKFITFTED